VQLLERAAGKVGVGTEASHHNLVTEDCAMIPSLTR